ncbi:alpha/beta hydrolase [Streptomyces sp. NPDC001941]|uniref:alpha/beta fold hydrolase n=1 Tax=Streptomyces sp. NPDC001941 TaxID=3154659 RepID=UPI00332FFFC8
MTELRATAADGVPLTALDDGSGPVLLLVHGGAERPASWERVTELLAGDFRVVRFARRIYVPGARVPPHYSVATEAADILAVAERLGGGPLLLCGHSSGAVAALEAALREPSVCAGLVLYEPPVLAGDLVGAEPARRARRALEAGDAREALRIHLREIAQETEAVTDGILARSVPSDAFTARVAAGLADVDALDALGVGVERYARLGLPVTLVQGDRSPAHLHRRLAALARVLPRARVVTLAGQGHTAHRTGPRALASVLREAARRAFPDATPR